MAVSDVARGVVDLCRQGRFIEAVGKYYSPDIVSVEPVGSPQMPAEQRGLEAVKGKNAWWVDNHEVHDQRVEGPFVGDTQFAVRFYFDVTPKMTGKRHHMTEMALYTVQNDKIVKEEFYYNMPGA